VFSLFLANFKGFSQKNPKMKFLGKKKKELRLVFFYIAPPSNERNT